MWLFVLSHGWLNAMKTSLASDIGQQDRTAVTQPGNTPKARQSNLVTGEAVPPNFWRTLQTKDADFEKKKHSHKRRVALLMDRKPPLTASGPIRLCWAPTPCNSFVTTTKTALMCFSLTQSFLFFDSNNRVAVECFAPKHHLLDVGFNRLSRSMLEKEPLTVVTAEDPS